MQAGAIGATLRGTITNGGTAMDVSAASTLELIFTHQQTEAAATFTAAFTNTGTDGLVQYTTTAATDFPDAGVYAVIANVVVGGQTFTTTPQYFRVR